MYINGSSSGVVVAAEQWMPYIYGLTVSTNTTGVYRLACLALVETAVSAFGAREIRDICHSRIGADNGIFCFP